MKVVCNAHASNTIGVTGNGDVDLDLVESIINRMGLDAAIIQVTEE